MVFHKLVLQHYENIEYTTVRDSELEVNKQ